MDQAAADVMVKRGFSQAFYREKLHEKHYGYPDLESFIVGFWEGWATSKGNSAISERFSCSQADLSRSGEHARHAADMAERRLLPARAVQWPIRGVTVEHQGKDTCPTCEDGPIFPVSTECIFAEVAGSR